MMREMYFLSAECNKLGYCMNTTRRHMSLSHVTEGLKVVLGVKKVYSTHMFIQVGYPSLPRMRLPLLIFHFLHVGSRWSWPAAAAVWKLY